MKNLIKEIEEYGLSEEDYKGLLEECAKKTRRESQYSWDEIGSFYGLEWTGDCIRKASQVPLVGGTFVKEYYEDLLTKNGLSDHKLVQLLNEKIRDLEKEKIKYRDQRNEWSKQNRMEARIEETLNLLEQKIEEIGGNRYSRSHFDVADFKENNEPALIVTLSDLHAGLEFKSFMGTYDSELLKARMNSYVKEVLKIAATHHVQSIYVVGLGDLISGNIHKTIAISNRENVIDQIKIVAEMISDFIYELCSHGLNVEFYNVSGNHSRISKKDEAVHDERLDDLIGWIVSKMLSEVSTFSYHPNLDSGITAFSVCGHSFVAVHGDFDAATESSVYRLSTSVGFIPYGVLCGHKHTPEYKELNGVKIIQSGSMCGSGDSYTVEKRLTGSPSQTVVVLNNNGIQCLYPVEFN